MKDFLRSNDFWAVTSYFNPTNSKRRLENFKCFRANLNVPLLVVEWAWDKGPSYQLSPDDAEILIQVSGPDLMWHKERLLNIGMFHLPLNCKKVAWLDCDVLFDDPDWNVRVAEELEDYPIVQPYGELRNLGPTGKAIPAGQPGGGAKVPIGNDRARSALPENALQHEFIGQNVACGYAWAARRELLQKHGLYDACIMGSGDRVIYYAAIGEFLAATKYLRMNDVRRNHYLSWAKGFFRDVRGRTSWVPGTMRNMWHGSPKDRRYGDRHVEFEKFQFDPNTDIKLSKGANAIWCSAKPEMHKYVESYFWSRNEDSE